MRSGRCPHHCHGCHSFSRRNFLKGSTARFIFDNGHHDSPFFGTLARFTLREIVGMIDELILDEFIIFDGEDFPVLKITVEGLAALDKGVPVSISLPWSLEPQPVKAMFDRAMLEALQRMRACTSKEQEIPPYMVFTDRTMIDLAQKMPRTRDELHDVAGLGETRIERFGDSILATIEASIGQPLEACVAAQ